MTARRVLRDHCSGTPRLRESVSFLAVIAVTLMATLVIACDEDDQRDGTRRFCSGVASVERSLDRVDALDRGSSTADALRAHDALQDGYHDLFDGHTALQVFGPRTIDISDISSDIEDLLEILRETADGEPIANQITDIERLSGDIAEGAAQLNEEAGCE